MAHILEGGFFLKMLHLFFRVQSAAIQSMGRRTDRNPVNRFGWNCVHDKKLGAVPACDRHGEIKGSPGSIGKIRRHEYMLECNAFLIAYLRHG